MDTVLWAVGNQASVQSEPALPCVLESCAHKDETAGQAEGGGGALSHRAPCLCQGLGPRHTLGEI